MMSGDEKRQAIASERSLESRYVKALRDSRAILSRIAGSANSFWTGSGRPKQASQDGMHLVGRVALIKPDHEILEGASEFYIGDEHSAKELLRELLDGPDPAARTEAARMLRELG